METVSDTGSESTIPLWVKLAFSGWMLVWAPAYAVLLGPQNFFWLCNLASFLILAGLWTESRLLLSMQWLAVALIGVVWGIDLLVAALVGFHPFAATAYMFDSSIPLLARALSFYHLMLPIVAGYAVVRLGYELRAFFVQGILTALMIFLSYFLTDPERNINWVREPFGVEQVWMPAAVYLPLLALLWPVLLYLPVHLLSLWYQQRLAKP